LGRDVNWIKVMEELRAAGISLKTLAKIIGCAPTSLYNLSRGTQKDPVYSTGAKILEVHGRLLGPKD
jgi:hypothetical protein